MQSFNSIAFILSVMAGLASAAPSLERRDIVSCTQRYGGSLALAGGQGSQPITLGANKQDTLTTDFAAAGNPGADDVQFVFSRCVTQKPGWVDVPSIGSNKIVGQLMVTTSGSTFGTSWQGGCVTLDMDSGNPRALNVEACANDTDDERLSRQWFATDDLDNASVSAQAQSQGYVTIVGVGAPSSQDAWSSAQQTKGVTTGGNSVLVMLNPQQFVQSQ